MLDPNNYRFVDAENYVPVAPEDVVDVRVQQRTRNLLLGKGKENVRDLIVSFRNNGFLDIEAIQVKCLTDKLYLVLEGNRRVATLKYRLEDEYLANARELVKNHNDNHNHNVNFDAMSDQEVAVWYNDNVIYPDKVRLNKYYLDHYSFIKDIQMIVCTVLGKKMEYAGEEI